MWQKRRYHEIFFMIDTCQAASMYEKFYSPNILAVASSLVGEDSLSHHVDPAIGVYIIDRYTYYALAFLERVQPDSAQTMGEFLAVCPKRVCISTVGVRKDLFARDPHKVPITDFFGALRPVEIISSDSSINLTLPTDLKRVEEPEIPKKKYAYASQFPTIVKQKIEL
uniref:GPI-anchor transamidase n=2 Tax=Homalodisca liturata TaxID=320908 RepID=A0A1B6HH43_9HEMI